ncbi:MULTISPECIES: hypothetical protein [unclassified Streptomyces]|uniref:hypothetical protein n=1 Tax=unclassified Streptomyces TaxID=2593676 RepID=UPI002238B0D7|nr:hypothetical protein [Streptomyces sp. SHP 1-2]
MDSLEEAAGGLSDDEVGAGWNRARPFSLREGVQMLRHTLKRGANGTEPNALADIHGSTWITSDAGPVVSPWGEAGDPTVSLRHLKQPLAEVGPFRLLPFVGVLLGLALLGGACLCAEITPEHRWVITEHEGLYVFPRECDLASQGHPL